MSVFIYKGHVNIESVLSDYMKIDSGLVNYNIIKVSDIFPGTYCNNKKMVYRIFLSKCIFVYFLALEIDVFVQLSVVCL